MTKADVKDRMADITKEEVAGNSPADIKVVMFPQLGYLVEIVMRPEDAKQVPLDYQVR